MFPPGGPDLAVGALFIVRSIVQQEPGGPDNETKLGWRIFGDKPTDGEVVCPLFGEITLARQGWFVGITAMASVCLRDDKVPARDLNGPQYLELVGSWLANVLYDFAAAHARQLIAATTFAETVIPVATPAPTIEHVSATT